MATDRRVVLTADSGELRRRLDPTTWMVFEELVLASSGPVDVLSGARCRSGRWHPGSVSPKTPSLRALGQLRRLGLVTAQQSRTEYRRVRDWLLHAHDPDLDQLRRRHPITGIHNNASRVPRITRHRTTAYHHPDVQLTLPLP